MANSESLADWQAAEKVADAAQDVCSAAVRIGKSPTAEQQAEAARLRSLASDKLQEMIAALKAANPLR